MGLSPFKNCQTNSTVPAPNPCPSRWTLVDKVVFENSYVLKVKYHDATNFDGVKVMVYKGRYVLREFLDPHFADSADAPVARFRPDAKGWRHAIAFAILLNS